MIEINEEYVTRFMSLFGGNGNRYGQYCPKTETYQTINGEITDISFQSHLKAGIDDEGIGILPVRDNGTCRFGAIDIDVQGGDSAKDISERQEIESSIGKNKKETSLSVPINVFEIEKNVKDQNLPLIVCRSKSGGAHIFLFASELIEAHFLRQILKKWAVLLGYPHADIFPGRLGSWINLPYHAIGCGATLRYAVENSKKITLGRFLKLASILQTEMTAEGFSLIAKKS